MSKNRLHSLDQSFDTWQVDFRQAGVLGSVLIVVSTTHGHVVALEMHIDRPSANQLKSAMRKAMLEPANGDAHRPTTVQLKADLADDLRGYLEGVNVEVKVVDEMELIEKVLEQISQIPDMPMQPQPGLLEMPGITPEAVGSFFDAAADFYKAAPWKKVGERPIKIACDKFDSGPWYAITMGQGGMTSGLVLYDDLDLLLRIQEGEEQDNARITAALTVVFGDKEDLVGADEEAIQEHGWQVAGPNAYPSAYRIEPGLVMRPPLVWELELLEGCLRAVPEFVRKKTRRTEPLTVMVGELKLEVGWAVG